MRVFTPGAVFVLLAASAAASLAQGVTAGQGASTRPGISQLPPRDRSSASPAATALLRGRVLAADSGEPLRRALVRASAPQLRESRATRTDEMGVYEFKDLPAGRYTLTASKGSYITLAHGQFRPFEPGRPIEIGEGQILEKVDFRLPRGSVITGVVVDEFGEPAADVQVMPMRFQYAQGRRRLAPVGRTSMTNDIGEFRLFGLPPGQYYVSATLRVNSPGSGSTDDRLGYAPAYYPGTAIVAEAEALTVGLGQALPNVTISLSPMRTARITGSAIDSDGTILTSGFVNAIETSGPTVMTTAGGASIRPDGSFTLSNIVPGEYTLQVTIPGGFGQVSESVSARVTVNGEDISGVQLIGVKPAVATGRVLVPLADRRTLNGSLLRLTAVPAQIESAIGGGGASTVRDDFTFELRARPGRQLIRLANPPSGWGLRAVRVAGVDVTDEGIELRPNQEVSGIEIELTNRLSEISGQVLDARNRPITEYSVVVFSRDPQRWGWMSRHVAMARPDQDGRFFVRGLPAGEYQAIALDYVDGGEALDPEFLDRVRPGAVPFSLSDGQTRTLTLARAASINR